MAFRRKNLIDGISDEITAAVGNVVSTVAPILKRNETPFFPDYTDHGIEHIESVLRTCEIIMSEDQSLSLSRWGHYYLQDLLNRVLKFDAW